MKVYEEASGPLSRYPALPRLGRARTVSDVLLAIKVADSSPVYDRGARSPRPGGADTKAPPRASIAAVRITG